MKTTIVERNIAVVLFVLVLVVFTLAQRDSKNVIQLYTTVESGKTKMASSNTPADIVTIKQ